MLKSYLEELYPSAKRLVKMRAASRVRRKDASLYAFDDEAQACASQFMGWTDLASRPPIALDEIQQFADEQVAAGIKTVVLIGQGGSTQAPMTLTKYNKEDVNRVSFITLDSDSPVRIREIVASCKPESTLVITSSKSGGTIEPRLYLTALRQIALDYISEEELVKHLVAITDPGSALEKQALEEGWLRVFHGEPSVGGRFSALSVFGLLPAALVGINLREMMRHARDAERLCSEDAIDNPAIALASFLYDNYRTGRNKFSLLTPKRGRVLGLWIEQLVAESLGKGGKGILPNIEIDPLLLNNDAKDRCVIVYHTKTDLWDERKNFETSLTYVSQAIPRMSYNIENAEELVEHFVMWEYAIALCGILMKVCPFDQPDVASAKAAVLDILRDGQPAPAFTQDTLADVHVGTVEARMAPSLAEAKDVNELLAALFSSIKPGDYFALNAFLPFTGEGRREALEAIRHGVGQKFNVTSCMEIGPRYLHSTGQLQKGGPNTGVFMIISADEFKDIPLPREAESLGALAKAQALGDLQVLSDRGRRCVHLHLPDNSGVTLRCLAETVRRTLETM